MPGTSDRPAVSLVSPAPGATFYPHRVAHQPFPWAVPQLPHPPPLWKGGICLAGPSFRHSSLKWTEGKEQRDASRKYNWITLEKLPSVLGNQIISPSLPDYVRSMLSCQPFVPPTSRGRRLGSCGATGTGQWWSVVCGPSEVSLILLASHPVEIRGHGSRVCASCLAVFRCTVHIRCNMLS